MANYPTLVTDKTSPKEIEATTVDRSEDGTARVRCFYSSSKVKYDIVHPFLSSAEKASLISFYNNNKLLPFDYLSPFDGVTRSCIFGGAIDWALEVGNRFTATVSIEQV